MVVDKTDDRIRTMFGSIAPRYDRMNHLLSMNIDRYWRRKAVQAVEPEAAKGPILDVCTGTGDLAIAYWKAAGGNAEVKGTDFCPEMLDIARQKKQRAGINGSLEFEEADTMALPFKSDTFQIVSVAFGLRNVADTMVGLREMARVCQPGGLVAILEFSMPERQPVKAVYGWYFRHILPRIGQKLAKNEQSAYCYLPESVGQFPSGDNMAQRLREVGLIDVSYQALTFGIATLYIGRKPEN